MNKVAHHTLKSTGQKIYHLPWTGQGSAPWNSKYRRYLIPNPHGRHHIQFISPGRIVE